MHLHNGSPIFVLNSVRLTNSWLTVFYNITVRDQLQIMFSNLNVRGSSENYLFVHDDNCADLPLNKFT